MRAAAPHAVALHCLPAHRGEEIAAEVLDGPRSLAWDQAANRLPIQQAVLARLVDHPLA
jgi:ornithine carbamoyltransferase